MLKEDLLCFQLFQGKGNRLDGKNKGLDAPEHLSAMTAVKRYWLKELNDLNSGTDKEDI